MKITVNRGEFDKALGIVSRAVSSKSLGSYQQFVKITASSEGSLRLEATDDDLYTRVTVNASVAEGGEFLVSPIICDLVSKMVGEEVDISLGDGGITVKSGRSRYRLLCAETDIFPLVADYSAGKLVSIPASILKDALTKTVFCAYKGSGERSSYYTSGVLFRFSAEYLDLVATDGHRLGLKKCRGNFTQETQDLMMPARNADEILRFLPDEPEANVELYLSNNQLFLEFDRLLVASSLLDVKFPDYSRVIPTERATSVTLDRKEMHEALRRAMIVSRAKQHNPVVRLKSGDGVLTISTDASDVGSGEESLGCEVEGEDIEIALNPTYLVDVMNQLSTEKVVLFWNSKVTPLVVSTPEDLDFTYVIMPIRIE